MRPLSRRTMLRGAAGMALGLPFLEAMLPLGTRSASADPVKPPRRVIFLLTPDGFEYDRWKIDLGGASEKPLTSSLVSASTISEFGKPDNDILDRCLFLEGVPMSSALDARNPAQGHPGGTGSVFTGAWAGPGSQYGGSPDKFAGPPEYESIDQILAGQIGNLTRFPSVYAGVHVSDNTLARRVFYAKGQTALTPEADPYKVLMNVFQDLDPAALAQAKARGEERAFVLDSVRQDYAALRCKVGTDDRARLDQHIDQLDGLMQRLNLEAGGLSCELPTVEDGLVPGDFASAPALTKNMMDLMAMTLACDLTRVIGFQLHAPDMDGDGIYSWLGHDMIFHQISHLEGDTPEDKLEQTDRWRAQQIMYLVKRLQDLKEADGSSVFDNTTILWTSEIGRGYSHDYASPVWNIIGDGQGYFKTGRYMKFSGDESSRHNLLLSHYLRYFGLDASGGVGHADYAPGDPLPGIAT